MQNSVISFIHVSEIKIFEDNRKQLDVTTAGSVVNTLIKDLDEQMFMHNNGYRFKNRSRPWNKRNTNRYEYNYEDQSINNWGEMRNVTKEMKEIYIMEREKEVLREQCKY